MREALLQRGPSLFTLAGWGKLSLVQMAPGGKDEGPQTHQREAGASQLRDPFSIQLLKDKGKEWAARTPSGAVGAGQIARGDKKRKSIVFPLHSSREKKKTSKAQAAVPHWETQGIWFELAEGTPPPVSRTTRVPAGSSPRKPAQPQPSSPPLRSRPALGPLGPGWSPAVAQSTGQLVGDAPGAGDSFVLPAGGAPPRGRSRRRLIGAPTP